MNSGESAIEKKYEISSRRMEVDKVIIPAVTLFIALLLLFFGEVFLDRAIVLEFSRHTFLTEECAAMGPLHKSPLIESIQVSADGHFGYTEQFTQI